MSAVSFIFSGSSHPHLAKEITNLSGISLGKIHLHFFPDQEIFVEILESVQGKNVFILQSLAKNPNLHLMELFIILDALKRASVASVTLILPYLAYARQDRIDRPGTPITAKLIADLLTQAGANSVITMDLHSAQIEGFFNLPVQQVFSRTLLIPYFQTLQLDDIVIVAPDKGGIEMASAYARELKAPIALIDKERMNSFYVKMRLFAGDVEGKTVILPDDICSTAGTLVSAANMCADFGAKRIIAAIGHGLFIEDALEKIDKSAIEMVITTDSIPVSEQVAKHPKIRIVSIASLFAEA